jgi:hypothetical protein
MHSFTPQATPLLHPALNSAAQQKEARCYIILCNIIISYYDEISYAEVIKTLRTLPGLTKVSLTTLLMPEGQPAISPPQINPDKMIGFKLRGLTSTFVVTPCTDQLGIGPPSSLASL